MSTNSWLKDNAVALSTLAMSIVVAIGTNMYHVGESHTRLETVEHTLDERARRGNEIVKEFEKYKKLLDSNVYYSKQHNANIKRLKEDVNELKSDQKVTNVILVDLKNVVKDLSIVTGELKNILSTKISKIEEKVDHLERAQ